jgi:hypothetical protein
MFTKRQMMILRLFIGYSKANLDEINDAFAASTEEDPDNEQGKLDLAGELIEPPTEKEIEAIEKLLQC